MTNESVMTSAATPTLKSAHVFSMALICLGAGLGIGFLIRSSQQGTLTATSPHPATQTAAATAKPMGHRVTLEQMRQLADKQAAPLLEKLKASPNDSALLVQLGAIYHTTHRFKEASEYYRRALETDPKNVAVRTKLASSLYRNGDVDGSIAQLNRALTYDSKDANALFDLGMIKLQGKGDPRGALAAWQRLLKMNPQLSPDRKATVMKLISNAMTMVGDQRGLKGGLNNAEHQ